MIRCTHKRIYPESRHTFSNKNNNDDDNRFTRNSQFSFVNSTHV